jgi:hypothetical protein
MFFGVPYRYPHNTVVRLSHNYLRKEQLLSLILVSVMYDEVSFNVCLATPLYPQKLALTSPTSGGRSVGIVSSRTKTVELVSWSSDAG